MVSKPQLSKILFTSSTERISFVMQYLIKISVIMLRDRANPAAFMPGLFFGALVWCLISGNFGIVFLDIAIVAIIIVLLYFGFIRFK